MHDGTISEFLLKVLVFLSPVLLVCVAGLILAVRFRRKAPAASLWTGAALGLGLFLCGQAGFGMLNASHFILTTLVPILIAATYLLFLIAVYVGRTDREQEVGGIPAEPIWQPLFKTIRMRPGLKNIFVAVFVIVFLMVFLGSVITSLLTADSYCGTARVQLWSNDTAAAGTNVSLAMPRLLDSRTLNTECRRIESQVILEAVIENLNLNRVWGKKYAAGDFLKTQETLTLARGRLYVFPIRDTSIIEIRFFSESADEAAKCANALATSYRENRARLSFPQPILVEIIDKASPGFGPVRPNRVLDIALGLWGGLWLGIASGVGAVCIAIKMENKRDARQTPSGDKPAQTRDETDKARTSWR